MNLPLESEAREILGLSVDRMDHIVACLLLPPIHLMLQSHGFWGPGTDFLRVRDGRLLRFRSKEGRMLTSLVR